MLPVRIFGPRRHGQTAKVGGVLLGGVFTLVHFDQQHGKGRAAALPLGHAVAHLLAKDGSRGQVARRGPFRRCGRVRVGHDTSLARPRGDIPEAGGPLLHGGLRLGAAGFFAGAVERRRFAPLRKIGRRRNGCAAARGRPGALAVVPIDAVAAARLGRIQRLVGAEDDGDVVFRGRGRRHAKAHGDSQGLAAVVEAGNFNRLADADRRLASLGRVGARQNNGELLAAVAGDKVHVPHLAAQHVATSRSTSSPTWCPYASLTSLKRSTSAMSSEKTAAVTAQLGQTPRQLVVEVRGDWPASVSGSVRASKALVWICAACSRSLFSVEVSRSWICWLAWISLATTSTIELGSGSSAARSVCR